MKTLKEFQESKVKMCSNDISKKYGFDIYTKEAFIYGDGFHIEIKDDKKSYALTVERSDYYGGDLQELELVLWDWVKYEIGLNEGEIEDDLHQRARDLMQVLNKKYDLGITCSLDEFINDANKEIEVEDQQRIYYLLDQFFDAEKYDYGELCRNGKPIKNCKCC